MATDPAALGARAARFRDKAGELHRHARGLSDRTMLDAYTALIAEYDALAIELERMAADVTA